MNKIKRKIALVMMSMVIITSVFVPYMEVKAFDIPTAFWGTLEYSRAFWTAMNTGGGLKGGVNISQFELSSREDMHQFQVKVMIAYKAFCIYKEKARLLLSGLTESEANTQGTASGTAMAERFQNNAINVENTTGSITVQDYGYWREFCGRLQYIAKNGLGNGIGGSVEVPLTINNLSYNFTPNTYNGAHTFEYNGKNYIDGGYFIDIGMPNTPQPCFIENVPTDRVRIPFLWLQFQNGGWYERLKIIDVNRLSGQVITFIDNMSRDNVVLSDAQVFLQSVIDQTDFPVVMTGLSYPASNDFHSEVINNYANYLSVHASSGNTTTADSDIKNALDDTEVGKAIKLGGTEKEDIVKEGYIPVKRSSLATDDTQATGVIGWDIPDARTLEGAIAQPQDDTDERKATGIISIPESEVEGATDDSTAITWPREATIDVPEEEDEERTVDDVLDVQGGDFYPTQTDITGFFPFCIPFDLIYLFDKFATAGQEAPVITIPIVYPQIMASQLGTDRYEVVIDFQDFVILRNIIRVFLLIGLLIGLMQITRSLIRG